MKIVTVATHNKGYLDTLKEGCESHTLEVVGFGEKWGGFVWKFKKMREYLETVNDDEIVIFVDGYDTLCLNTNKILERFHSLDTNILVSKDCVPDNIVHRYLLHRVFKRCNGVPINTGMYMGYVGYLKILLAIICKNYDCNNPKLDDQKIFTELCNSGNKFYKENVKVDIDNRVFTNIMSDNLFSQKIDMSKIQSRIDADDFLFIQGPGNANLDEIVNQYGFLNKGKRRDGKLHILHILKIYYKYFWLEFIIIFILIALLLLFCLRKI